MNRQIKLDSKYYERTKIYLNNRTDLRRIASVGGEGQIYINGSKRISGVLLQICPNSDQIIVSEINEYNAFPKIEKDLRKNLEKLTKENDK